MSIVLHAFEDLVVEPELEWFSLSLDTLVAPADRVFFTQQNTTIFIEDKNSEYYSLAWVDPLLSNLLYMYIPGFLLPLE